MQNYLSLFLLAVLMVGMQCKTPNKLKEKPAAKAPVNVIFMVGDGMGLAQIALAIEHAQDNLVFGQCKYIGFSKTSAVGDYITDSAAGATAFSTGHKTKNKAVAVDSLGKKLPTILELAFQNNWATGLVATSSLTHATPACYFAHQSTRYMHKAIANDFYNSGVDIAIGGGKPYFNLDSLNMYGYQVASGLDAIKNMKSTKWVGFYNDSIHPPAMPERGTFLPLATEKILNDLKSTKKPFFVMIEGSQIDWGGHANNEQYVVNELLDFNAAIKKALQFLAQNPNTLIVVTADHETGGLTLLDNANNKMKTHFSTKDHSGIMVPVFAFGKGAEQFTGIYENTQLFYKLKAVMGI